VDSLLDDLPEIKKRWRWLGLRSDIPQLLSDYHALIHPSFYEGLPNVVCEALSAGRPVLASNVCDHSLLVKDGERGFLFNPEEPKDIADAIARAAELGEMGWKNLSRSAREYAEENLDVERMIDAYEDLFAGQLFKANGNKPSKARDNNFQ
jgi:glycosyltransferase involved in cell wall biosynthesis